MHEVWRECFVYEMYPGQVLRAVSVKGSHFHGGFDEDRGVIEDGKRDRR